MVDTGDFQRFAGSTERAPDARLTLVLHSARASQVISLGLRAQSCICWKFETRAAAGAREHIFDNLLVNAGLYDPRPPHKFRPVMTKRDRKKLRMPTAT